MATPQLLTAPQAYSLFGLDMRAPPRGMQQYLQYPESGSGATFLDPQYRYDAQGNTYLPVGQHGVPAGYGGSFTDASGQQWMQDRAFMESPYFHNPVTPDFLDTAGPLLAALPGIGVASGFLGGGLGAEAGAAGGGAAGGGAVGGAEGGFIGGAGGGGELAGGGLTGGAGGGAEIAGGAAGGGSLAGTGGFSIPGLTNMPPGVGQLVQRLLGGAGGGGAPGAGGTGGGGMGGSDIGSILTMLMGAMNLFGNGAIDPAKLAQLWQAGSETYNLSKDPRGDLYNRTAQRVQDQTRAGEAARGLGNSPVGAAMEDESMRNFNIDWAGTQLDRQLRGLTGLTGASGGYFNQANADRSFNTGQNTAGTNALLSGFTDATRPGGWLNSMFSAFGGGNNASGATADAYTPDMTGREQWPDLLSNGGGYDPSMDWMGGP